MTWSRDTNWRQGCILPKEALVGIGKLPPNTAETDAVAVVISHDCDITNDDLAIEPDVEIVLGRRIEQVNGALTHAKSSRRLHLIFNTPDGEQAVELFATHKQLYPKESLANFAPLAWQINTDEHATLQSWLAARYRRSAFPDCFNNMLSEHKLDQKITKILKPLGRSIAAVFFDLEETDDLYQLAIDLLYDTSLSPDDAERIAQQAADKITAAFEEKLCKDGVWHGIELVDCAPLSDQALTYRDSRLLKQWRLEHLSLRDNPQQTTLAD